MTYKPDDLILYEFIPKRVSSRRNDDTQLPVSNECTFGISYENMVGLGIQKISGSFFLRYTFASTRI
jgi:hypothetical protein